MKVIIPSGPELERVGITLLGGPLLLLQCRQCGHTWEAKKHISDWLRADYWHCPRDCNIFEPEPKLYTAEPETKPKPEPEPPKQEIDRLFASFLFNCQQCEQAASDEARAGFAKEAGRVFGLWLVELADVLGGDDDVTFYLRRANYLAKKVARAEGMAKERLKKEHERALDRHLEEIQFKNLEDEK